MAGNQYDIRDMHAVRYAISNADAYPIPMAWKISKYVIRTSHKNGWLPISDASGIMQLATVWRRTENKRTLFNPAWGWWGWGGCRIPEGFSNPRLFFNERFHRSTLCIMHYALVKLSAMNLARFKKKMYLCKKICIINKKHRDTEAQSFFSNKKPLRLCVFAFK